MDTTEFHIKELFPTPVALCQIEDHAALNDRLREHIYSVRARDAEGRIRSNASGWQSTNLDYGEPAVSDFCAMVLEQAMRFGQILRWRIRDNTRLVMHECWANINPRGGFNNMHIHPNSLLSGAYYVRAPEHSGAFIILDPRKQAAILQPEYAERTPLTWDAVHYPPREGRLVLFPSWLEHGVAPNETDEDRISLSFNLDLKPVELLARR